MSGNDDATVRKDTSESPSSDRETEAFQEAPADSEGLDDPGIDAERVVSLPGTGGPDDAGDIDPSGLDEFNQDPDEDRD